MLNLNSLNNIDKITLMADKTLTTLKKQQKKENILAVMSEATHPKISKRSRTSSSDGASRICLQKRLAVFSVNLSKN